MSSDLIRLFWLAFHIVEGVLYLWIACVVFRSRTTAARIVLIAAILCPLFSLTSQLYYHLHIRDLWSGADQNLKIGQALKLGYGVTLLVFLIGLLLHLQRRKLESDRIADLEAILQDQQQNSDPR